MLHDCLQHFYVGGRKAKQNIQVVQNLGNIRQCTPKYFHTDVSAPRYAAVGQMSHDNVFISGVEKFLRMALFIPGKGQVVTTTKRIGHWGSWLLILRVILCLLDDKNANEVPETANA